MAADVSIYSMIRPPAQQEGPLDQFAKMMSIKQLMDSGALNDLQRRKLESDLQEEQAFKDAFRGAQEPGKVSIADLFRASPARALQYQKTDLENRKSSAELRQKEVETLAKGMALFHDQLKTVRDEPTYQAAVEFAKRTLGPDLVAKAGMPAQYDPEFVRRSILKGEDMLTPKPQAINLGGREVVLDMNPWTNPKIVGMDLPKSASPGESQPVYDEQRGVFVTRPAGGPAGAPAAPSAQPASAPVGPASPAAPTTIRPSNLPPRPTDVHTLRNEFNQLPEVKSYRDVIPIIESARAAPDTRAGDIQLAYAVGKILDPNSVVREGELKLTGEAATLLEKYKGEITSTTMGNGRLTPKTRGELIAMLDNAVGQREGAYRAAESTYKGIAGKNGIPVDQVIITPQARTRPSPGAAAAKPVPSRDDIDAELRRRGVIR
jgi:hypothetical protein